MPLFASPTQAQSHPGAPHAARSLRHRLRGAIAGVGIALAALGFIGVGIGTLGGSTASAYPEPSIYPVAWEFDFDYRTPQRMVIDGRDGQPQAYYYMVYTVTNDTDEERLFLPVIEMLAADGRIIEANRGVPNFMTVFNRINEQVRSLNLTPPQDMFGTLRVGEDQAKSSVAIWQEPKAEMGTFHIFIGGLSGETATLEGSHGQPLKDEDGRPIVLRKTRQLTFKVRGDEVAPERDTVVEVDDDWVMR